MLDFVCENEKFAEMRGTPVGIPPVFASSDRQSFSYSRPLEPSLCNRTLRLPRLVRLTGAKRLSVSCFGRPLKFWRKGAETALRAAPRGPQRPAEARRTRQATYTAAAHPSLGAQRFSARAHANCAPPPRWREDETFALCTLSRSFAPLHPTPALEPELEKAPEWRAATR